VNRIRRAGAAGGEWRPGHIGVSWPGVGGGPGSRGGWVNSANQKPLGCLSTLSRPRRPVARWLDAGALPARPLLPVGRGRLGVGGAGAGGRAGDGRAARWPGWAGGEPIGSETPETGPGIHAAQPGVVVFNVGFAATSAPGLTVEQLHAALDMLHMARSGADRQRPLGATGEVRLSSGLSSLR